jgi:hypothetical protein
MKRRQLNRGRASGIVPLARKNTVAGCVEEKREVSKRQWWSTASDAQARNDRAPPRKIFNFAVSKAHMQKAELFFVESPSPQTSLLFGQPHPSLF